MCGRYALTLPPEAVRAFFTYVEQPNFPPRYNIAPTQPIAIVRRQAGDATGDRHFQLVRWGLVPPFVKDFSTFRPIVNARSEGLVDKPSFRNAFRRRRCIVIADGFYEWHQIEPKRSQPYLVRRHDHSPFGLAGLVETWLGADGSEIDTACIITTGANPRLAAIHSRMPVVIERSDFDLWLDPDERHAPDAETLLRSSDDIFDLTPIGSGVNKVSNDDASLQQPIEPDVLPASSQRSVPTFPDAQGSLF